MVNDGYVSLINTRVIVLSRAELAYCIVVDLRVLRFVCIVS